MSDPRIVNAAGLISQHIGPMRQALTRIAAELERIGREKHDPEATQLLDAGYWRCTSAEGEERWVLVDAANAFFTREQALDLMERTE